MDDKKLGLGLGLFSIGLGLLEVAAPEHISRWLRVEGKTAEKVTRLFGGRERLARGMLLRGPAVSTNVWNRVFCDMMDVVALGLAFGRSDRKGMVAKALAFVGGATLLASSPRLGSMTRVRARSRAPTGWPQLDVPQFAACFGDYLCGIHKASIFS